MSPHYAGCDVAIAYGMEALITNDLEYIAPITDKLLHEKEIMIDKTSLEYKALCREMLKAFIEVHEVEKDRVLGRYEQETGKLFTL